MATFGKSFFSTSSKASEYGRGLVGGVDDLEVAYDWPGLLSSGFHGKAMLGTANAGVRMGFQQGAMQVSGKHKGLDDSKSNE